MERSDILKHFTFFLFFLNNKHGISSLHNSSTLPAVVFPTISRFTRQELMSRRQWIGTATVAGILVLYILVDIAGKAMDQSRDVVEVTSGSSPTSAGVNVEVQLKAERIVSDEKGAEELLREKDSELHRLRREIQQLKATQKTEEPIRISSDVSLRDGASIDALKERLIVQGSKFFFPQGEDAWSVTKSQLDPQFPSQAPMPGGPQCVAAMGIPTGDTEKCKGRREAQRATWRTYDGVRSGAIQVRYLLGRHPSRNYSWSPEVVAEGQAHQDIYALRARDGVPTRRNEGMSSGFWGFTAALGISRKAFMWYRMGAYYNCSYILKGDDDMYWNIPQYLHDIQQLPTTMTMWGKGMHYGCRVGKKPKAGGNHCVYFIVGMVLTISRDVVMGFTHLRDFLPLADRALADDSEENMLASEEEYSSWTYEHEDVMVGRLVRETEMNVTMYDDFRFHDCGVGLLVRPVSKWSIAMHRCTNWNELRSRFTEESVIDWKLILNPFVWKQSHKVAVYNRGTFLGYETRLRHQFIQRVHPPGQPLWD